MGPVRSFVMSLMDPISSFVLSIMGPVSSFLMSLMGLVASFVMSLTSSFVISLMASFVMSLTRRRVHPGFCLSLCPGFISHKVFSESVCRSQFPEKSVNLFFILVKAKDKLTDLWRS
jgi:hypothetical protein